MNRRKFLSHSAAAMSLACLGRPSVWAAGADARIEVFLDETIGHISPDIYGHFTEHIGGVVYDGIWVGEDSKIPHQRGIRSALVEHMRQIKAPVIRWPGGCFADSYDWRDGIGPAAKRPRRTNFWEVDGDLARLKEKGAQVFEPNSFGTDEFMRFCKLCGAEAYLAANLRSLPALVFDQWVEYCNSPVGSTTLAEMRAANGSAAPYGVRFWGVGNESWGCGGNFDPKDYASEFRRFTTWIPRYGVDLQLIGSGPSDNDTDWTHAFFDQIFSGPHAYHNDQFAGWSIHHYSFGFMRDKATGKVEQSDALQFDRDGWYNLLNDCASLETIMNDHWATMEPYDPQHHVKLVVDEYGPWHREGTELDPTHLFGQQITVRDALGTALTLDVFNRNAEKILLATNAQLINNINALFLAHEDRFVATPNFYVFAMYAAHQGADAVRADFAAPNIQYTANGKQANLWSVNGSASRKGNTLTITVVNTELDRPMETQVALRGASAKEAKAETLASSDMHAHNTFADPQTVMTKNLSCSITQGGVALTLPPASVNRLAIELT
ncbi:alpha-N-arabinofuranosidase [Acidicapsa dinghuensis]|uniref:non-reducing end alpha-L-arabinofuranosidase n=1 Tax=Acidicapsa dinghuensis TaxID=2218256 RepID=A0ABW1EC62_9BACT|nr:alpha-L-arabinofuranosidase C-terminal domain-containing protein [Acidicapsa dinghuensis]